MKSVEFKGRRTDRGKEKLHEDFQDMYFLSHVVRAIK